MESRYFANMHAVLYTVPDLFELLSFIKECLTFVELSVYKLFSLYFCINSESSSMVCVTLVANMVKLICSSCRYNVQAQHIYRL